MEMRAPLLAWKLSLAETLAFGCTVAAIVAFSFGNFTSKSEAQALERRIENLEKQMHYMRDDLTAIRVSVEYVRGRMEAEAAYEKRDKNK